MHQHAAVPAPGHRPHVFGQPDEGTVARREFIARQEAWIVDAKRRLAASCAGGA